MATAKINLIIITRMKKEKLEEEEECKHITLTIGHTTIIVSNSSLIKIIV